MEYNSEEIANEFFANYRGRYSRYWIERFGLIPELPTSFDNANSIYELLAWLQRAFKQLLDDFIALENELEDFRNAFIELLENLIPILIRRYMESEEFDKLWTLKADKYYQTIIKPYIDKEIEKVNNRIDREVATINNRITTLENQLNNYIIENNKRVDAIQNTLEKIINNLKNSGAWNGGLDGDFNQGRNIATGNINLFGGAPDGNSFIRTNNGSTENDLAGGI